MTVGFVGLGLMGSRMAANVAKETKDVWVWNRSAAKAERLKESGCHVAGSLEELATVADVIFSMVATPEAVQAVSTGKQGFLSHMRTGTLWVDCSTVNPSFSKASAALANQYGVRFMDAPVSGSTGPAEKGELVFLMGGDSEDLEQIRELLNAMGSKIVHAGPVGSGAALKMVVNLLLGQSVAAFAEATSLGIALGVDKALLLDFLLGSKVVAPVVTAKREAFIKGVHEAGFPLKHMHKDMFLAHLSAYEAGVPFFQGAAVEQLFGRAKAEGYGEENFTALYEYVQAQLRQ